MELEEGKKKTTFKKLGSFSKSYKFHLLVGTFVIISSFVYGITSGLNNRIEKAHAGSFGFGFDQGEMLDLDRLSLPPNSVSNQIGKSVRINNKEVEMVGFFSNQELGVLVRKQTKEWKERGFKVLEKHQLDLGIVLARDEQSSTDYSFMAWVVPQYQRELVSRGKRIQGVLSVRDNASSIDGSLSEEVGEVPGVPVMPGGKAGAVFSALDPGGRSYTSIYSNPGSIEDSMQFYKSVLAGDSWQEKESSLLPNVSGEGSIGQMLLHKGGNELTLLFVPRANLLKRALPHVETTGVSVVLTSRR